MSPFYFEVNMYKQLFKFHDKGAYKSDNGNYDSEHFLVVDCEELIERDGWYDSFEEALANKPKSAKPQRQAKKDDKKD